MFDIAGMLMFQHVAFPTVRYPIVGVRERFRLSKKPHPKLGHVL